MVAPNGMVNEATVFFTPILSVTVLSVTGIEAFELEVPKANDAADFILDKNNRGFRPESNFSRIG